MSKPLSDLERVQDLSAKRPTSERPTHRAWSKATRVALVGFSEATIIAMASKPTLYNLIHSHNYSHIIFKYVQTPK